MKIKIEKDKPKKGAMARKLVCYCIGVLSAAAVWAVVLTTMAAYEGRSVELDTVLTFIGGVFGGELLMLLCKRVFAKANEEEAE